MHFASPAASVLLSFESITPGNVLTLGLGSESQLLPCGKPKASHVRVHAHPPPAAQGHRSTAPLPHPPAALHQEHFNANSVLLQPELHPDHLPHQLGKRGKPSYPHILTDHNLILYFWNIQGLKCRIWGFTPANINRNILRIFSPNVNGTLLFFYFLQHLPVVLAAKHCSIVPARGAHYKHICLASLSGPVSSAWTRKSKRVH